MTVMTKLAASGKRASFIAFVPDKLACSSRLWHRSFCPDRDRRQDAIDRGTMGPGWVACAVAADGRGCLPGLKSTVVRPDTSGPLADYESALVACA